MGCDAYADENGQFYMEVRDHETGQLIGHVQWHFADGGHKVSWEILKGEER